MNLLTVIALIGATVNPALAFAQAETPQWFVSTAAQDGMLEVELAKLASARSQNPEVTRYANRMVAVHAEANAALEALAIAKGLKAPTRLDAEHQSMIEFFKGKWGDEFDAAYMRHIATANAKTMALFGRASRLNDVGLATFAKRTLPTLREHAQLAQSMRASPGNSVATSSL